MNYRSHPNGFWRWRMLLVLALFIATTGICSCEFFNPGGVNDLPDSLDAGNQQQGECLTKEDCFRINGAAQSGCDWACQNKSCYQIGSCDQNQNDAGIEENDLDAGTQADAGSQSDAGTQADVEIVIDPITPSENTAVYTFDADFEVGNMLNVVHDPSDQLQLDGTLTPFDFIWVAVSGKGTTVKINTQTGEVLAEYRTAPNGMGLNPSRTTVDKNGSAWVTNRNEGGFVTKDAIAAGLPPVDRAMGSVVHFGLEENGQCEDRNGNGIIETSRGLGDVRDWSNAGGADTLGGVSTAEDECIIHYLRVNSKGARHVSVDADNNVWISGTTGRFFDLVDGELGTIIRQEGSVGVGGYGGLIDAHGVIWSARQMMRWDTAKPLKNANVHKYTHDSYGLCIDSAGNVWNTSFATGKIHKFAPDGTLIGSYSYGSTNAQGCVVDGNDHVWVAHSLRQNQNTVGHLLNNGKHVGNVKLEDSGWAGPTGVAVDAQGFIWATGYNSQKVYKIDPNLGQTGNGGVKIGKVVLSTVKLGGFLYNYSDMTGSTLLGAPGNGTWSVIHDSGQVNAPWVEVSWTADEPGDSAITVSVATSADGVNFGPAVAATNGARPAVAPGRYIKAFIEFTRSSLDNDGDGIGDTCVLYDLTLVFGNT